MPPDSKPASGSSVPAARGGELKRIRVLLTILAAVAVISCLYLARGFLVPLALSLFFAMLLAPLVNLLRRLHVPRAVGAGIVMLVLIGVIAAIVNTTMEPARDWLERSPSVIREIERKIRPLQRVATSIDEVAAHAERVAEGGPAPKNTVAAVAPRKSVLLIRTPAMIVTVVGTFFLTFFLLAWGPTLLRKIAGGAEHPTAERAVQVLESAQHEIAQYLGTVAVINVCLGIATAGLTAAFGLPTPMLWGVLAATLNFIPYAGSAVTLCVITMVALLTQPGLGPGRRRRLVLPRHCDHRRSVGSAARGRPASLIESAARVRRALVLGVAVGSGRHAAGHSLTAGYEGSKLPGAGDGAHRPHPEPKRRAQ